jgi:hypothetical protein
MIPEMIWSAIGDIDRAYKETCVLHNMVLIREISYDVRWVRPSLGSPVRSDSHVDIPKDGHGLAAYEWELKKVKWARG